MLLPDRLGVTLSSGRLRELLIARGTLRPVPREVDGQKQFVRLHLDDQGQVTFIEETHTRARGAADGLGRCPACGGEIIETPKSYGCANWRDGCRFTIWKIIAGKRITRAMAKKLLSRGETGVLTGFKSKSGKAFDAKLILAENQVKFNFPDRGNVCESKPGE